MNERWIDYADGDQPLRGYWIAPEGERPRATVLVVHTFRGLTASIQGRAARLAADGYAAFALDVFGPGVRPADHDTALKTMMPFVTDRVMFRRRLRAGLDCALAQPVCDPARVGAIGYCFGGGAVLEMARDGQPLAGVVSLHGEFGTTLPAQPGRVRAKVLALHGDADMVVKPEAVAAFEQEMRAADVDFELVVYAGARHSFTGEGMGADSDPTAAFNGPAEIRAWARQADFLREHLTPDPAPTNGADR